MVKYLILFLLVGCESAQNIKEPITPVAITQSPIQLNENDHKIFGSVDLGENGIIVMRKGSELTMNNLFGRGMVVYVGQKTDTISAHITIRGGYEFGFDSISDNVSISFLGGPLDLVGEIIADDDPLWNKQIKNYFKENQKTVKIIIKKRDSVVYRGVCKTHLINEFKGMGYMTLFDTKEDKYLFKF